MVRFRGSVAHTLMRRYAIGENMKTWQQKFDNGKLPQVKIIDKPFGGFPAGTSMYISTPAEIDRFINQLKLGESLSVAEMRDQLASSNNTDFTCALTTGIFLRIVAERAYEQYVSGESPSITPFWRVLDPSSKLAAKLTFDKQFIVDMRQLEKIA